MKMIFTVCCLVAFLFSAKSSDCGCDINIDSRYFLYNFSYNPKQEVDSFFNALDSIHVVVNISHDLPTGGCSDCELGTITWFGDSIIDNGLISFGHSYLIKDTGSYMVIANIIGSGCYSSY